MSVRSVGFGGLFAAVVLGGCGQGTRQCDAGQSYDPVTNSCTVDCALLGVCGGGDARAEVSMPGPEAALETGPEASPDAQVGPEAEVDAAEAGLDAAKDTGPEAMAEAGPEAAVEAGPEAAADAGPEASVDAREAGPVCGAGQMLCGAACATVATDVANCGSCGNVCPTAPNAHPTCASGACGVACNTGSEMVGSACEVRVPRQLAPLSTSNVTSQRPTLRWALPMGISSARVELCRDRAMTRSCTSAMATGASFRPAATLAQGWWFWRVRGVDASGAMGSRTSAVWQFWVGARDTPVDSSYGTTLDLNGDGARDLVVMQRGPIVSSQPDVILAYVNTGSGLPAAASTMIPVAVVAATHNSVFSAGDLDGDGFGDVALMRGATVEVYSGGASGIGFAPSVVLPRSTIVDGTSAVALGDVNGDGYGDLGVFGASSGRFLSTQVTVLLGGISGVDASRSMTISGGIPGTLGYGTSMVGAGDWDSDGYSDIVVLDAGLDSMTLDRNTRLLCYRGGSTGVASTPTVIITTPSTGERLSGVLAGPLDYNGDGRPDVAVSTTYGSAPYHASVLLGTPAGISSTFIGDLSATDSADLTNFGREIVAVGDLNGDGNSELVVNSDRATYVFFGATVGLGSTLAVLHSSTSSSLSVGPAVSTAAGDLNGDGLSDLVIGDQYFSMSLGQLAVYNGSRGAFGVAPNALLLAPPGAGVFGYSIAIRGFSQTRWCSI